MPPIAASRCARCFQVRVRVWVRVKVRVSSNLTLTLTLALKVRALLPFFRAGRILPVLRGGGTGHHFVDEVVRKVEEGEWVHVFPTGKRDPDSRSLGPLKPGVGRIIASCEQTPVVVPFYHYGMERIQCKARGQCKAKNPNP